MKSPFDVENFEIDVLRRSEEVPVLVDFWAEWCGPCKVLGPVLERLAAGNEGAWALAKVDTERFPDEAARYNVQSIPNVKLFVGGDVVAEFVGALPEYSIRQWLRMHLPGKHDDALEQARALLEEGAVEDARTLAQQILAADPQNPGARIVLAKIELFRDPREAERLIAGIEEPPLADDCETIATIARLLGEADAPASLPASDAVTHYRNALAALRAEEFARAVENFIEVIRSDRYYNDDASRKACIAIFRWLGDEHPVTLGYRRDFSGALY